MIEGNEFSVCQFFEDETYEYVRRFVSPEEAVRVAKHYCTCVAAKIGTTRRVIITDGGDEITFEWKFGEGIVFPTEEQRLEAVRQLKEKDNAPLRN